jgi:phospholipid/cholesterol/gamma-HCH transport system substrate-binding protein
MSERQLQFRVGLFALAALVATGVMIFQFGEIRSWWEPRYPLVIHFAEAPGIFPGTPVRKNGVPIGKVRSVDFDEEHGGVQVVVDIKQRFRMRLDSRPELVRSLLGDASIEFQPGSSEKVLAPGSRIKGNPPTDPFEVVERMEKQVTASLEAFNATAVEWRKVGRNLNSLVETNRGNLDVVIERAAESLHQVSTTMQNANVIVGDPRNQENMRKALEELPKMVAETRQAIVAVRSAVEKADANLANLGHVTLPLAQRSTSIITRLDATLGNLEGLSSELHDFAQIVTREDGTLKKLATDPELYERLTRSAGLLTVLLQNLEPVLRDMRIFSDRIARHPELMGVGGAMKPSSGVKDPLEGSEPVSLPARGGGRPQ